MAERISAPHVGAPDPERRNSVILDETADDAQDGADLDSVEFATCYFNQIAVEFICPFKDVINSHIRSCFPCIRCIAIRAGQVAAAQPDKGTGHACTG